MKAVFSKFRSLGYSLSSLCCFETISSLRTKIVWFWLLLLLLLPVPLLFLPRLLIYDVVVVVATASTSILTISVVTGRTT